MNTVTAAKEFEKTTTDLFEVLSLFNEQQLNRVPYEGSWTPGQVAEHIFKSQSGVVQSVSAPAVPTQRQPDEKVEAVKSMFLDFTTKMKSPDFVIPSAGMHYKEKVWADLKKCTAQLSQAINTMDLSETFTGFEIPGFGAFTRLEWVSFAIYHTQRHIHQLKKMANALMQQPVQ